ncbi:hypothetical protein PSY73_23560, partial [Shigella flexneri]|nr:hypothetical protein [Shigella flexneri]
TSDMIKTSRLMCREDSTRNSTSTTSTQISKGDIRLTKIILPQANRPPKAFILLAKRFENDQFP